MPLLCGIVSLCLLLMLVQTRHWPMVGDASIVHYAVFLMDNGMQPYRQIFDVQLPGTYLLDWVVVHTLGGGATGLWLFDWVLLAIVGAAMVAIAWPLPSGADSGSAGADRRYEALLAAGLFALLHGRDGILELGQRDLVMTSLVLAAYALGFHAVRGKQAYPLAIAGFLASAAATIKPTVALTAFLLFPLVLVRLRKFRIPLRRYVIAAISGLALPWIAIAVFLFREHAGLAFLSSVTATFPYLPSLQRRSLAYLFLHSFSPLLPLVAIWIITAALRRWAAQSSTKISWEQWALYTGLIAAFVSYVAQRKGFAYHRYPFLAFLLLLMMFSFGDGLRSAPNEISGSRLAAKAARAGGLAGLLLAVLFFAPVSLWKLMHYDWRNDDYYQQLSADLGQLGGRRLSGRVQCVDGFDGCINTLYRMKLVQSTGFDVDFLLFAQTPTLALREIRQSFWQQIQQNPPQVFVVTSQRVTAAPTTPDSFAKLSLWPEFQTYLAQHYRLQSEHSFTRDRRWMSPAQRPAPYRVYVRNP